MRAEVRRKLGLEAKSDRASHYGNTKEYREAALLPQGDLLKVAAEFPNISAKHEGGDIEDEKGRHTPRYPGLLPDEGRSLQFRRNGGLLTNYLDKHAAVNRTALALDGKGAVRHSGPAATST